MQGLLLAKLLGPPSQESCGLHSQLEFGSRKLLELR